MKRVFFKIFIILISIIFVVNTTNTYAFGLADIFSGGKSFIEAGQNGKVTLDETKLQNTSSSIYNILLMISFIIVAVVGIYLGIKFMLAGVEEKADVKKSAFIFFIGAVVVFGAFGIWKVLLTFLNTI